MKFAAQTNLPRIIKRGGARHSNKTASLPNKQIETNFDRLRYDRLSAAELLSISVRTLDYRISNGQIKVRRDGNKVLIPHSELVRYARADHPFPVRRAAEE
jgi:excisionase family DNA binding protein